MTSRHASTRLYWPSLACLLLGLQGASAQGLKLNGPLPRSIGGDIRSLELSRDGARLVYVADQDVDERTDLYSVDARAASPVPVRLNLPRDFADVQPRFLIAPDGGRVLYVADQETDDDFELFLAPIDGSAAPRKLNGPLVANGDVDERFELSPNGKRVVYLASQVAANRTEIFSAPLDGSAPSIKLDLSMPPGKGVGSFSISPDSRRVVFLVPRREGQIFVDDLWSASIDGRGGAVLLLENAGDEFSISPDGTRVFAPAIFAVRELCVVPVTGGLPLRLTPLPAGRSLVDFELTARGERVVYSANANTRPRIELFSVKSDGSGRIQLSAPASGSVDRLGLQVSPDGRRAIYFADVHAPGVLELFSVPVDGSELPVRLEGPSLTASELFRARVEITADSKRVVYLTDQDADERFELHAVPLAGGSAIRLNAPLPPGGAVVDFDLTPDSSRVVYIADQDMDEVFEAFVAPLDGSAAPVQVSAPLEPDGDVALRYGDELLDPLRIAPDGRNAFYLADQERPDVVELFRAPLDGTQQTARMNRELAIGPAVGDVLEFQFAPDGRSVVYRADQDENDIFNLYRVRTDGRGPRVRLNGDLVAGGAARGFHISPDGTRVVYSADQNTNDVLELYTVPLDGNGPPLKLNGPLAALGDVSAFQIDPTGRRVTFRADQAVDERHELFSVPIDASAPAVRLSGTMVPGGTLYDHRISPDGTRVIYRADQDVVGQAELYSAAIDGSSAAARLNGTLVAGTDVYLQSFSCDSRWIVYVASQEAVGREEVYGVPIDGSAAPIRLSGASVPGANVGTLSFTPAGTRVVFDLLLPGTPSTSALFVAPRDGSLPPLQLSAAGDFVLHYDTLLFSPDGLRVLYVASVQGNLSLCSVPVDGSAPRVQISLGAWSNVEPILVAPGGRVVFSLYRPGDRGLFSVPIDGSAAPVRLAPVVPYDPVLLPDGETLLYIAERALHRVPLDGSAPPRVVASEARAVSEFEVDAAGSRVAFLLGNPYAYSISVLELYLDLLDLAPGGVDRARSPGR